MPPMTAEWHPAFEEYCETIYELSEDSVEVVQARIAERLEVSRPSVSEMIKRLAADGFVETTHGTIRLTAAGTQLAERVVRRHRLAERFLCDVLGLSWAEGHHEAGKWEHVIGPEVEAALVRLLGEPTTCPHGNPIPGSGYEAAETHTLGSVGVGSTFVVERIPESLEFQPGVLDFLQESHIVPGAKGAVTASAPDGTVTLEIDGRTIGLGAFASDRILVTT